MVGRRRRMLNTLHLQLGCDSFSHSPYPPEPTVFIPQADSLHSVWHPVLSAAVGRATRPDVSGPRRAAVPHSGLPVRDPHECKSVCHEHILLSKYLHSTCIFPFFSTLLNRRGKYLT